MELGSWGWDYEAWVGPFYPGDLPEDWRLDFYANEFNLAVVPGPQAAVMDVPTLSAWDRDLPAGFEFLIEVPAALRERGGAHEPGPFLDVLAALRGRLRGLIWPVRDGAPERLMAFREMNGADIAPLHLLGELPGSQWDSAARGIGHAWSRETPPGLRVDGPALVEAELPFAELRMTVESYRSRVIGTSAPSLVLTGQPPDPARLREVRTLLELMGI